MNTQTTMEEFKTSIPKREKTGEKFVFFAGDVISPSSKQTNPKWRQGGIVLGSATLKHNGGYLPRCRVFPLQDHFHGEQSGFIAEDKKDAYVKTYTLYENGKTREIGRREVAPGDIRHDGLLRRPIYPADEITRITAQRNGVVEMPASTREEARALEVFLMTGLDAFPERMKDLKTHFARRLAAAQTETERLAAERAIESCEQYLITQGRTLKRQMDNFSTSQTKGHPYTFGERAELLFEQIGEQRPDRVQQQQAGQMDALTSNISKLVEIQTTQTLNSLPPSRAELDEIAELKAEIARLKGEAGAVEPAETVQETRCAATTGSGERCAKDALDNGYCSHPAHQKLAE